MKGCFERGQSSNDLSHVEKHVKTGEGRYLEESEAVLFKSRGREAPLC